MISCLKALKPFCIAMVLFFCVAACSNPAPVKSVENITVDGEPIVVTILGSGTPIPTPDQFGASILVQAGGHDLLFDCGRGCTTRLAQVDRSLITGVEQLFITHLHSDHIVGIDDLWLNGWTQGRKGALDVYGPPGTKKFFTHLRKAFSEDIKIRLKKGVPATTDGIKMTMKDIGKDTVVFDKDGVSVTAFLVDHKPVDDAFGYRVDYAGRSVVISGDTKPSRNLVKHSKGADVVFHEVMAPTQIAYIKSHFTEKQTKAILDLHTTAEQAGKIFNEISPRLAVYYHTRNTPADEPGLISSTRENFSGELKIGHDLLQIEVGDEIKSTLLEH